MTVLEFGSEHKKKWKNIFNSIEKSKKAKLIITNQLECNPPLGTDIDLVVFGSIARNEYTSGSDVDWTLLIDGQSSASHIILGNRVKQIMKGSGLNDPSPSGLFGQLTCSHELINFIGGQADTNYNLSRRILLLLESESISLDSENLGSHKRIIKNLLQAYIENDSAFKSDQGKQNNVPRFLLNDIVRFWRTMCVDFAYKQREQDGAKWALRNIKLRMSRKMIFLKGLLMCAMYYKKGSMEEVEMIEGLTIAVNEKPLDFIVGELTKHQIHKTLIFKLLDKYNIFLEMLNKVRWRKKIEEIPMLDAYNNEKFMMARDNANEFQTVLTDIFFKEESLLKEFTIKYGVF